MASREEEPPADSSSATSAAGAIETAGATGTRPTRQMGRVWASWRIARTGEISRARVRSLRGPRAESLRRRPLASGCVSESRGDACDRREKGSDNNGTLTRGARIIYALSLHKPDPRVRKSSNADDQGDGSDGACSIATRVANGGEMITIVG